MPFNGAHSTAFPYQAALNGMAAKPKRRLSFRFMELPESRTG
jgi:hypothetical protein